MLDHIHYRGRFHAGTPQKRGHDLNVVALLDWDHLPYELSQPGQGVRMSLLRAEHGDQALSRLCSTGPMPDILLLDEDFFGSPEAAAEACLQILRRFPSLRVLAIESEMWEGDSVLSSLRICHGTLPAAADSGAILGALSALH